ncbi:MAG: hypothetical protein M3357_18735 [Actinomycetota bacterium]|jgi:hypothetical protein|nr:hypothetical protein [Actinomycetota bacterium]
MSDNPPPPDPDPDLVASRARALNPEEKVAGVDDPDSLAGAVLADSEARTADRKGTAREHRHSEDTVDHTD